MSKLLLSIILLFSLIPPAYALEITAPPVPDAGAEWMPAETDSFGSALGELVRKARKQLRPDLTEAAEMCIALAAAVLLTAVLRPFITDIGTVADIAGTLVVSLLLLNGTNAMIRLGSETIREMSDYGKLFFPVMTTAMAAQGGLTASAALYLGTALLDTVLSTLISGLLVPAVYLYLLLAIANRALGDDLLKKMGDMIKNTASWILKTLLMIFTTYMSITGVVSGTTDAAALKATKVTISSVVPVVGGILSDASEAVLVSAGMVKNAAGVYGILAILALFLGPFLQIGIHYLMLKITTAACSVFGPKNMTGMIEDFSGALGLLLAMTGSVCLLLLISTTCFMKGIG